MLAKKRRIPKSLFPQSRVGRNVSTRLFSIKAVLSKGAEQARFSCVVSKKISSQASVRNKVRRRVYSAIEKLFFRLKPDYLVIVYAKKGSERASYPEVETDLLLLLAKADILLEKKES